MREGLRSRTRLGTVSGGGGVVHKENVVVKNDAGDLGGEGLSEEKSSPEKKGEVECRLKEECGFDLNVSASASGDDVDLDENGGDRSCSSGGGSVVVTEVDRITEKEQCSNEGVVVGGRVLRSRLKRGDDRRLYDGENEDVVSGNNRKCSGYVRVKVKRDREEDDEFLPENEGVKVKKSGNGRRKLKRKRGRPPKMVLKEEDQSVDQSPARKRGRPPLAGRQNHSETVVHRRSHLAGRQNHPVRVVAHKRKRKAGLRKGRRGLTMRDGVNVNAIDDTNSGKPAGDELENEEFSRVKKNSSKVLETDKSGEKRNKVKQLVRDQIKERLTAAGWTVDYRPRHGREYMDAVYVSLDGHTHWSITLAYKRLKEYYEAGNGEGKAYGPGFKFTPIPEEDFKILTKVINKQRKEKGIRKGGKKADEVSVKKNKGRLGSGAGMSRSMKKKMKRKRLLGNTDGTSPNRMLKRQKTQNKKRCGPLVRNTEEIDSETEGYELYSGKRTLLAWMIDLGIVLENVKVHYMPDKSKSAVLDGKITGDGIHCGCCNEVVTISDFEVHAVSKVADPLKNIYVEEGTSLLQCLLDSWNKQDESERKGFHFVDVVGEDPNDDTCGVCGDGGDLICCDGCPSTFHQGCLDIKKFPSGDWHCIYCCCKFCGCVSGSSDQKDGDDEFTVSKLLTCQLCEKKYHRSCIGASDASTDDSCDVFCGNKCQELSESLEMLLGVKHEIEDGYSWSFIRRSDVGTDASQIKPQMVECNSKLAVALSIMDECFMPYIDHKSGINLIHSITYNRGSNFNRLNYSGFITAILERGDEIICAASIRIHGNQLAEMPFIGTRYMYRRQGMCRRLLNAIEFGLRSLNVELLVIPAISELRETWTSVFGFEPLESKNKQITNNMNLLVFPHVDMLQKKISNHELAGQNLISTEVSNLQRNQIANNCDGAVSPNSDLINCSEIPPSNVHDCHPPEGSLNNVPDIASNTSDHRIYTEDYTCQVVPENSVMEDSNSIENACDVTDTCRPAEDSQLNNCGVPNESLCLTSCISTETTEGLRLAEDSQLNNCGVPNESLCLTSCISTETTEGLHDGALLEDTENSPNQVKVAYEIISNNNAENSAPCGAESIPLDSNIVCGTRDSKDSADCIHQDSYNISDSCGLRSKTDCGQPNFIGTKEVHALHWASTGSASCGNTEGIVLSNQAS